MLHPFDLNSMFLAKVLCRLTVVSLLLVTSSIAGCSKKQGPERAAVEGSVDLDGNKLAKAVVRFVPTGETKGPAVSATVTDGVYKLPEREGPLVGTHRVEVDSIDFLGFEPDDESAFVENVEKKRRDERPKNPIHQNYNKRSTLAANVKSGEVNHFDFHLRADGAAVAAK
jgi:hypothetical protein